MSPALTSLLAAYHAASSRHLAGPLVAAGCWHSMQAAIRPPSPLELEVQALKELKELKTRELELLELSATRGRAVLTADAAASYLGMSKSHILELARDQQIKHGKRGKFVYFQVSELEKWMAGD